MIFELDCGNSLIKFRIFDIQTGMAGKISCVTSLKELSVFLNDFPSIKDCRFVSVRGSVEDSALIAFFKSKGFGKVVQAAPSSFLCGVANGYKDYAQLGLDRWLAIVAAYNMYKAPCLVFDFGTAVTVDFVDATGCHLGGCISPGLKAMKRQLIDSTGLIRKRLALSREFSRDSVSPFSKDTCEAVESGCYFMLKSYLDFQVSEAFKLFGNEFFVVLTGGDSCLFDEIEGVNVVPDLVFKGLAMACPL